MTTEELSHMTDRELLVKVVVTQDNMQGDIGELKAHSATNNGIVAELVRAKNFTYGALAMLAFLMTLGIPLIVWGLNQL